VAAVSREHLVEVKNSQEEAFEAHSQKAAVCDACVLEELAAKQEAGDTAQKADHSARRDVLNLFLNGAFLKRLVVNL